MPVDGSSRKTTEDFPIRAIAVLSLRLLPPLRGQRRRHNMKDKEKDKGAHLINLEDRLHT
jgi:hypothetical protein